MYKSSFSFAWPHPQTSIMSILQRISMKLFGHFALINQFLRSAWSMHGVEMHNGQWDRAHIKPHPVESHTPKNNDMTWNELQLVQPSYFWANLEMRHCKNRPETKLSIQPMTQMHETDEQLNISSTHMHYRTVPSHTAPSWPKHDHVGQKCEARMPLTIQSNLRWQTAASHDERCSRTPWEWKTKYDLTWQQHKTKRLYVAPSAPKHWQSSHSKNG